MEKVLERLKDEIKFEQVERQKLSNFKDSKFKRLNQLEDLSKKMELMSSIDIDKVLNSLGQKDRQLEQLKTETKESAQAVA